MDLTLFYTVWFILTVGISLFGLGLSSIDYEKEPMKVFMSIIGAFILSLALTFITNQILSVLKIIADMPF